MDDGHIVKRTSFYFEKLLKCLKLVYFLIITLNSVKYRYPCLEGYQLAKYIEISYIVRLFHLLERNNEICLFNLIRLTNWPHLFVVLRLLKKSAS